MDSIGSRMQRLANTIVLTVAWLAFARADENLSSSRPCPAGR
jgi:hypothetical protein